MNRIKIPTTVILGAISIVELLLTGSIGGSIVLWAMYGIYKLCTQ